MSDLPGTRKLPQQPIFPERLDPKVERALRWQWEELARYINTLAVAIPFTDNNYNGNYEISTVSTQIWPVGNYNNFNDQSLWAPSPSLVWGVSPANGNLTITQNTPNALNATHTYHSMGALIFRPLLFPDANRELEIRMLVMGGNYGTPNNNNAILKRCGVGFHIYRPDSDNPLSYFGMGPDYCNGNIGTVGTSSGTFLEGSSGSPVWGANLGNWNNNQTYEIKMRMRPGDNNANNLAYYRYYAYYYSRVGNNNFIENNSGIYFARSGLFGLRVGIGGGVLVQTQVGFSLNVREFEVIKGTIYG